MKYIRRKKPKSIRFATQLVKKAIGELNHDNEIFCFNKGQFGLIDIIAYILKQIGKSNIDILTWAIGDKALDEILHLQELDLINNMRIIIDYSYIQLHPEYCQKLRSVFGDDSIRVTKNHSKILLIRNNDWNLSIRSSMNLNINRRLEYFEISDDIELMGYFVEFFEEWFETKSTGKSFEYSTTYHSDVFKKFRAENDDMNFDFDIDFDFEPFEDFNIDHGKQI